MAYNVLIVDDSETTRSMIAKTLRLAGVDMGELFEASDGVEALEVLRSRWVDVVFADLNMPVMDGLELISHMREDGLLATVPVVVVSTEGSIRRMGDLCDMGVVAYVRKPFTPEELGKLVREILAEPAALDLSAVEAAFQEALEGFAFRVADRVDPAPEAPERVLVATMRFSGTAARGSVTIAVAEQTSRNLAADALGVSPDEAGPHAGLDTLRELLNVTCGRILTALYGDEPVFDLAPPHVEPGDAGAWHELASHADTLAFDAEGEALLLSLAVDRGR